LQEFAESVGIPFIETSAKDGTNVHQAFFRLATEIIMELDIQRKVEIERNQKMEELLRQQQFEKHNPPRPEGTPSPDYSWITGFQPYISHRRLISYGGFGEVHEVIPHLCVV